jgi:SSS family transporter
MLISWLTSKKESNADFFAASRKSKWHLVAFGMIGSSVSGISLVAVPAMVQEFNFTYLQMCLGFIVGYIVVAIVLLPLYYKNNPTSIYGYLETRFGNFSHKTGSWFFIVSKIITSASKFYIAILVLQQFFFSQWSIPIWFTIPLCIAMIWLYTFRGGIKTIVFTDALQSFVLFLTIILMLWNMVNLLNFSFFDAIKSINSSEFSRTFIFSDIVSPQNFFKQFFSGIFIVIVMTGLSQDMMQTTLSCKNLKDAKKNMIWYGTGFVPLNLLLLALGALMLIFAGEEGVILPDKPDKTVPMFCFEYFSPAVCALFILGIIAATFNSADSALTSIATIFFIDILKKDGKTKHAIKLRKRVYFGVCIAAVFFVMMFANMPNKSLLDAIYTIVGYAYGPLLGLFVFGLFTKIQVKDEAIPFLAILSPILTYGISFFCKMKFSYSFGYEILLINGFLMFTMMLIYRKK